MLHPTKTKIADVRTDGFDFLALSFPLEDRHFQCVKHWPRKKSLDKLKDTLRTKTPRNSGQSLHYVIQHVNQTLVGWFGYFQSLLLAEGSAIPVVENAVLSDTALHFERPPAAALKLGSMALLRSAWRAKRQAWLAIRLWRKQQKPG